MLNCQEGRTDQIENNRKGNERKPTPPSQERNRKSRRKLNKRKKNKGKGKKQENEKGESERIRNSREELKLGKRYTESQNSRMFDKNTQFHLRYGCQQRSNSRRVDCCFLFVNEEARKSLKHI